LDRTRREGHIKKTKTGIQEKARPASLPPAKGGLGARLVGPKEGGGSNGKTFVLKKKIYSQRFKQGNQAKRIKETSRLGEGL